MKKHSSRRAFLKGMGGAILALPLLEYTHGRSWAAGGVGAGRRFVSVFSHGGTIYNMSNGNSYLGSNESSSGADWWSPPQSTAGVLTGLGAIHEPLAPHMAKLSVVRGIDNKCGLDQGTYGGGHGHCNNSILTAGKISSDPDTSDPITSLAPSIDFVLAQRLAARLGGLASPLHLMIDGHNYGTPYFAGSAQPQSGESDPQAAFDSIFAGVNSDGTPNPAALKARAMRKSVLDGVIGGYPSIKSRLGAKDKQIVEAHLDHIRSIETALAGIEPTAQCLVPDRPPGTSSPGDVVGNLHVEIILAALRCGVVNVANLEIADILAPWAPSGLQVESAFDIGHSLHHMARTVGPTGVDAALFDAWALEMKENRQWRIGLMKQLLDGLDDANFIEGDKTMLDNSIVYYTSEFSRGEQHGARDSLVLYAGSAGGYLKQGHYVNYNTAWQADPNTLNYSTDAATNNLYITFMNALGESDTEYGAMEHTYRAGPLAELIV